SKPLAAKAGLAAERLLCDEGVRTRRAGVHLVVDEVMQLKHIDVADRSLLLERLAGATIEELRLAVSRQAGGAEQVIDFRFARAVEDGCHGLETQLRASPTEMRFQNLADVHAARNAQRIQQNLHRRAIC